MTTYSLNPTYYQVTWNLSSPNNFSTLTSDQAGGLDSTNAWNYNRLIHTTGNTEVTSTVMSDGETIIVNDKAIIFDSSMTLANVISRINLASKFTNVIADQRIESNYITLANAPGSEGYPFSLAEGNGSALSKLGLVAGTYQYWPNEVGSAFSAVGNGDNVVINGINITFSAGPLTNVITTINENTPLTGVVAQAAAGKLQLASVNGQPYALNSGTALVALGFVAGNHGGYPTTITTSQNKERANLRWVQAISEMEEWSLPILVGDIVRTGNLNGNGACTTFTFTVGYDRPDYIRTVARPNEPDAGTVFEGTLAIKRAIARAMVGNISKNCKVFDPTLASYSSYTDRPNAARIQQITAQGLDIIDNIAIIEQNISVTQIPNV